MKTIIKILSGDFYKKVNLIVNQTICTSESKTFFSKLSKKYSLKDLITSENLDRIINYVENEGYKLADFYQNRKKTPLCENIIDVLGYARFRVDPSAIWFGEKLNIKSCLFCNSQYATIIEKTKNKKQVLFQFDHFYPKSKFPYLSMSVFNLVPICSNCNQSKSSKTYKYIKNPYIQNFNDFSEFEIDKSKIINYLIDKKNGLTNALKLVLKDKKDMKLLYEYDKAFKITAKHKLHEDLMQELAWKYEVYTPKFISQLKDLIPKLSDDDFKRFIIGNYTKDKDIFKRPLAKMTKDIAEDLNLI